MLNCTKKNIFGKAVSFSCENNELASMLFKAIKPYRELDLERDVDIHINFSDQCESIDSFVNSPSIHKTFSQGFEAGFGRNLVRYTYTDRLTIDVEYNSCSNFIKKFRSIGFGNKEENLSAFLHEIIFVPMVCFFDDIALIHASSIKNNSSGKAVLFGGTGGVGKTSLELLFCFYQKWGFIADDISVVSDEAKVFPNSASPKIYAYNVVGDKELESVVFKERGLLDRLQWLVMFYFKGGKGVRRAVRPSEIYGEEVKGEVEISSYYNLFRSDLVKDVMIGELSEKDFVDKVYNIIDIEYSVFFDHIKWYENNCKIMELEPIITMKLIEGRFKAVYKSIYKKLNCNNINAPVGMQHQRFLKRIFKKLEL
jgi:hypothetical protein